jgi:hypothetical protein
MSSVHLNPLRFMRVLFVGLILSVSFAAPAEDVPETSYDESESLPSYVTPVASIAASETAGKAPAPRVGAAQLNRTSLIAPVVQRSDLYAGLLCPICHSLIILDRSFRC